MASHVHDGVLAEAVRIVTISSASFISAVSLSPGISFASTSISIQYSDSSAASIAMPSFEMKSGLGARPASRPVVCAHGRSRAQQLPADHAGGS